MAKVVYLIGAGASANGVPTVRETKDAFKKLYENLIRHGNAHQDLIRSDQWKYAINGFKKFVKDYEQETTFDLWAKRLAMHSQFDELEEVKKWLVFAYSLIQYTHRFDERYDAFIGNIIGSDLSLRDDIQIMSWNYDVQFEITLSRYLKDKTLMNLHQIINHYPKLHYIDIPHKQNIDEKKFALLRFNGVGLYYLRDRTQFKPHFNLRFANQKFEDFMNCKAFSDLLEILIKYDDYSRNADIKNNLSFAWEQDPKHLQLMKENIEGIMKDAKHLVIVGYSFPQFNEEIDNIIIRNCKKLDQIYIQIPGLEQSEIENLNRRIFSHGIHDKRITVAPNYPGTGFFIPY